MRLLDGRYNGFTTDQIVAAMLADGLAVPAERTPDAGAGGQDEGNADAPTESERHGVEIRIGLTTLLGLDDHPAELPGWGPILAQDARLLVSRQHAAEWCFAITDPDGYLLHGGITRIRPCIATTGICRGGAVEIHVSETRLRELAWSPDLPPEWAGFVAELARRHVAWCARPGDRDACLDEHPRSRFPHLGLRRHVRLRDRTCVAPGCRRPARKADQDHTRDHAHGGITVRANLAPLCERHHLMKHEGGWNLAQPEPGRFVWCSPLRQTYRTRGEPIAPDLPDPLPRNDNDDTVHSGRTYDGPILPRGPDTATPPLRAGPPPALDDGPPPF